MSQSLLAGDLPMQTTLQLSNMHLKDAEKDGLLDGSIMADFRALVNEAPRMINDLSITIWHQPAVARQHIRTPTA